MAEARPTTADHAQELWDEGNDEEGYDQLERPERVYSRPS